jgi:mannosyltransferase
MTTTDDPRGPATPTTTPGARADRASGDLIAPPVDRVLLVLAAVATIAGVVLRFLPRTGMWLDEALTANISGLPLGEIGDALRVDGHPPLYYVLANLWMELGGDGDRWIRALPALISVASLPLAYLAGRRLASRAGAGPLGVQRTSLIALSLMALLPYGIRYAGENRMYSLATTLVLAGYLLVDDLLSGRAQGRRRLLVTIGAALVTAALLWSHYWSMWLLAGLGLLTLWRAVKDRDPLQRTGARYLVGALVAGGLLFLPWVPTLLFQSANTGTPWGVRYGPASVVVISIVDFAGARWGAAQLLSYVLVVLIVLATTVQIVGRSTMPDLPGGDGDLPDGPGRTGRTHRHRLDSLVFDSALAPRTRNELIVMGLTMGLGWVTAYASNNTFASRYAAVVYPLFVLCVAAGLALIRQTWLTSLLLASVLALSVFGVVGELRFERSQTEPIATDIREDLAANDVGSAVVIACPDQLGVALQRQLDQQVGDQIGEPLEVIPYPNAGNPRFVDWVDYGERNEASDPVEFVTRIADRVPTDATIYLVSSPSYRTFEGKCEQLATALSADRDVAQLVSQEPDLHDETADLLVMRPRA